MVEQGAFHVWPHPRRRKDEKYRNRYLLRGTTLGSADCSWSSITSKGAFSDCNGARREVGGTYAKTHGRHVPRRDSKGVRGKPRRLPCRQAPWQSRYPRASGSPDLKRMLTAEAKRRGVSGHTTMARILIEEGLRRSSDSEIRQRLPHAVVEAVKRLPQRTPPRSSASPSPRRGGRKDYPSKNAFTILKTASDLGRESPSNARDQGANLGGGGFSMRARSCRPAPDRRDEPQALPRSEGATIRAYLFPGSPNQRQVSAPSDRCAQSQETLAPLHVVGGDLLFGVKPQNSEGRTIRVTPSVDQAGDGLPRDEKTGAAGLCAGQESIVVRIDRTDLDRCAIYNN